ncbi:Metallophosphoesterase MPPED2 [Myotis davidii]|uniref:Metallophosphoesterase MPPED2 n=3 Tax=Amniota TaxID=32524 RepID=L5MH16_MYODS|nr:Metallophosphoesterase MPPED2 [Myotis davidii]
MAHGIPSQGKVTISVDEYSSNPTQAFTHYNINQSRFQPPHVHMVDPIPYDTPKPAGHTRFVCISDTHSRTDGIQMPYGDILLHTGDFTELGLPSEVKKFNDWLDSVIKLVSSLTQPLAYGRLPTDLVEGDNRASVKKSKRQTLEGSGTGNFKRFRVEEGAPTVNFSYSLGGHDFTERGLAVFCAPVTRGMLAQSACGAEKMNFEMSPTGKGNHNVGESENVELKVKCHMTELKRNLPYEYKIVIAGNHELTFDKEFMADLVKQDYYRFPSVSKLKPEDFDNVQSLLTNSIYLQDSEVTVKGFRIYGAPWTPWFNGWGFNLPRGQSLLDKWNLIPEGIDILMTHGPPLGFRDWVPKELQRVGCVELLNTVQRRVRPKLHVFGGIHEGYGIMTDGYTTYINASTCTVSFQPTNPPIIFDLPNPQNS